MKVCVYVGYNNDCLNLDISEDDYNDMEENEYYKEWKDVDKLDSKGVKELAKSIEAHMLEMGGDGYEVDHINLVEIESLELDRDEVDMFVGRLVRYLVSEVKMNVE